MASSKEDVNSGGMIPSAELLTDAFDRIRSVVHDATNDLTPDELAFRVDSGANSIAWLIWHLTRIHDDHLSDVMGREQLWTTEGWARDFDLPFPTSATGFGHASEDVAAVRGLTAEQLVVYHDAVADRTREYLSELSDDELDRVVDESWDPPVTLGVRLVSVIGDSLQHAGQAAFLKGIIQRRPSRDE